jgi:hypothetical protein
MPKPNQPRLTLKGGFMLTVFAVLILGWLLASTIGTWAYFAGKSNDESTFALPKFVSKP